MCLYRKNMTCGVGSCFYPLKGFGHDKVVFVLMNAVQPFDNYHFADDAKLNF